MNQCVPSWNLDEPPTINLHAHSNSSNSFSSYVPSLDYEVAELTWENGQLTMHALGPPRVVINYKPITASSSPAAWDKPRAGGTLESIVDQATCYPQSQSGLHDPQALVPWTEHHIAMVSPAASASVPMTMDALVPCNNNIRNKENSTHVLEPAVPRIGTCMVGCSTRVGSCSGGRIPCVGISSCRTNGSESSTCLGSDSRQATTLDTWERELGTCPGYTNTTTSLVSPENTISGTKNSDDRDSVCHSRLQREAGDAIGKKKSGKSSVSTKRSRAAAIHNQSERKRRDRINQRMKTLQKLVPNSSKTDKASMLDEVIEHLKQLQAQIHLMNRMNMSPMMLPLAIQQQLQMSMMGMGMGMGMHGMGVMDMNAINLAAAGGMPPFKPWDNPGECLPAASSVMPDPLSAFIARQSQVPTTMDAYSRLAALYQQFQHPPGSASH